MELVQPKKGMTMETIGRIMNFALVFAWPAR